MRRRWALALSGVLLTTCASKVIHVDSMAAFVIRVHVVSADVKEDLAGVEVFFRDVGLDEGAARSSEKAIGATGSDGSYNGTYPYLWGTTVRHGKPVRPRPARQFELIFKKPGFSSKVVTFDLDKLPKSSAVNTYEVTVEVELGREAGR